MQKDAAGGEREQRVVASGLSDRAAVEVASDGKQRQ